MLQLPLAVELLSKGQQFNNTIEAFKTGHGNYRSMFRDKDEIQDSQDYYESQCARIANFQETIHQFITSVNSVNYKSGIRFERFNLQCRFKNTDASSEKLGGGSLAQVHSPRLAAATKRQLQKQMPQPSINSKLYSKTN